MATDKQANPHKAANGQTDLADQAAEGILGPNPFIGLRPQDILASFQEIGQQAVQHPTLVIEQEAALVRDLISILSGQSNLAPAQGDKRFGDTIWKENPLYRICLQGYLAWTHALQGFVEKSSLDARTKNRARFVVALLADALAPTNTLLGNPAALKKTLETRGANLLAGIKNLAGDMIENGGLPAQVDKTAFTVGKNLAISPGMVVFRSPVLELIQYAPATESVYARPHLIVPPEINKFYVFDLSPGKSIVEYMLKHGAQIFAVSWRNPTAKGDPTVHAMTLMVAVLGHTEGTLGLFATEDTVAAAKMASSSKGVLDGNEMNRVFAWLRPNDLVWNYWVNNYLMGNSPPVFDILYWSNDSTRLPAKFHGQLIDIFTQNLFLRPGALEVLGTPIDLSAVGCDKFFVAGTTDHITPWKGVYDAARAFGGRNDFILSSSGHIQSLINPPGNPKAKFFVNPALVPSPDDWLKGATQTAGSWWDYWRSWAGERSGKLRPAPKQLGSKRHKPVVEAPGAYVLEN